MTSNDLVSVIIPVYNVKPYLNKCLESIVNQSYNNLEILLIDDGSSDGSSLLCDEWSHKDSRVIVFHSANRGPASSRNAGLKYASGNYICFVDSDDYIDEDMIEKMVIEFTNDSIDVVSCGVKTEYSFRNEARSYQNNFIMSSNEAIRHLLVWDGKVLSAPYCKLYKKDVLNDVCFDETLLYGEDTPFVFFALLNSKNFKLIDTTYYHYVRRSDSLVGDEFNPKHMSTITASEKIYDYCVKFRSDLIDYSLCSIAMNCYFLLNRIIRINNWDKKYLSEYETIIKKMRKIPVFNVCRFHSRKTGIRWIYYAYLYNFFRFIK